MLNEGIFSPVKRPRGRPPGPSKPKPLPQLDALPDAALVTDVEVSAWGKFSRQTVKTWRMKGKGPPFVMVEGAPRYPVGSLRRWLAGQAA